MGAERVVFVAGSDALPDAASFTRHVSVTFQVEEYPNGQRQSTIGNVDSRMKCC